MKQTLIIFSGLPGTGKSTLATLCREKLQIPLFAIDDVVSFLDF
jgi:adenylate kinase family enzyme